MNWSLSLKEGTCDLKMISKFGGGGACELQIFILKTWVLKFWRKLRLLRLKFHFFSQRRGGGLWNDYCLKLEPLWTTQDRRENGVFRNMHHHTFFLGVSVPSNNILFIIARLRRKSKFIMRKYHDLTIWDTLYTQKTPIPSVTCQTQWLHSDWTVTV